MQASTFKIEKPYASMINLNNCDNILYVLTKRININDDEKTFHEENVIK